MRKESLRVVLSVFLFVCLLFAAAVPARAQAFVESGETTFAEREAVSKPGKKAWIFSALALIAASALDAHSSQSRMEMNPLLRGRNGTFDSRKAILVKAAANGGLLLLQAILVKKMPERNLYKPFAITNAIAAGVTAGTALRNYNVAPAEKPAYLMREGSN